MENEWEKTIVNRVQFKDANLLFAIRGNKALDGERELFLEVMDDTCSANGFGVFTKVNLSTDPFLKNFLTLLSAGVRIENAQTSVSNMTFSEFKEKYSLDWKALQRHFLSPKNHIRDNLHAALLPPLTLGLPGDTFLKIRGNVLSLNGKKQAIDVVIPHSSEPDESGFPTMFFRNNDAIQCGFRLFQQFSLSEYPERDRNAIEEAVNDVSMCSACEKTLLFNLLNIVASKTPFLGETYHNLPENPVRAIYTAFKETTEMETKKTKRQKM